MTNIKITKVITFVLISYTLLAQSRDVNRFALGLAEPEIEEFIFSLKKIPNKFTYEKYGQSDQKVFEQGTIYLNDKGVISEIDKSEIIIKSTRYDHYYFNNFGQIDSVHSSWIQNGMNYNRNTYNEYNREGERIECVIFENDIEIYSMKTYAETDSVQRTDYHTQDSFYYTRTSVDDLSGLKTVAWFTSLNKLMKKTEFIKQNDILQYYREIDQSGDLVKSIYSVLDSNNMLRVYESNMMDSNLKYSIYNSEFQLIETLTNNKITNRTTKYVLEYEDSNLIRKMCIVNDTVVQVNEYEYDEHRNKSQAKYVNLSKSLNREYKFKYNSKKQLNQRIGYDILGSSRSIYDNIEYLRVYKKGILYSYEEIRDNVQYERLIFKIIE